MGVGFSPNSKYLYFNTNTTLLQYDLEAEDIEASKDTIAVYDGYISTFLPTTFFLQQLAPDGKIYLSCTNTVDVLHVIHNPDEAGQACNMEQHGTQLPTLNLFSIPNFPNYRLGPLDGSPCDTLGLNNTPVAFWRNDADTLDMLHHHFVDLSYYEPAAWHWDFGDGTGSTERNPEHYFPEPGDYEVCLRVSNEYAMDTECKILSLGTTATEPDVLRNKPLKVYPNPADDYILLEYLPESKHVTWTLYDAMGRVVMKQQLVNAGRHRFVLKDDINTGLYFWMVKDGVRVVGSGKVLIQ